MASTPSYGTLCRGTRPMGVGTGGAEGAAAPPTFGTGEQTIALAPPKV